MKLYLKYAPTDPDVLFAKISWYYWIILAVTPIAPLDAGRIYCKVNLGIISINSSTPEAISRILDFILLEPVFSDKYLFHLSILQFTCWTIKLFPVPLTYTPVPLIL